MNTNDAQRIEETKAAFIAAQTKQHTQAAFLCLFTLFSIFVLPHFVSARFGMVVMAVGVAVSFSTFFYLFHDKLRSRSGSLVPAFCLLAFILLCSAIPILLSFFGAIE